MNKKLLDSSKKLIVLLENPSSNKAQFAKSILTLLSNLLEEIINLEPKFHDYDDQKKLNPSISIQNELLLAFEGECSYCQVFDPFEDTDAVTFSLVNDLSEIYEGFKEYIFLAGTNPQSADWVIKESFRGHLNQHVLNAMKVLYIGFCKDE